MAIQTIIRNVALIVMLCSPVIVNAADVMQGVGDEISEAANKVGDAASDTAITTSVKAKLALEKDIPMLDVSVTTNNGVVTVEGVVPTALQADRVIEIASSVTGVVDVNAKNLKVQSSESFLDDAMTTAKAKGKLMQLATDNAINGGYDLHVETTNGIVHVFGSVNNDADIKTITNALGKISGVKEVKTNIDVKK